MAQISPPPEGYPKLASRMGHSPQFAIFRRFAALNARNLLYLQAELTALEKRLEDYAATDEKSSNADRAVYSRDWETLKSSLDEGATNFGHDKKQWQTFLDIRAKLKEYNEALFLQSELTKLEQPNPQDVQKLTTWMGSTAMGNVFLLGPDSDIWQDQNTREDLVALKATKVDDSLTRWLMESAAQRWHYWIGHYFRVSVLLILDLSHVSLGIEADCGNQKPEANQDPAFVTYSDEGIAGFQRTVTTLLSCLLPVLAIVILYFVPELPKRLGILAGLVAGFAGCLLWFTNAGGGDIFAATAA
ncbi:uncharacterized protein PAC_04864 [Phialocephala subalpina]|uniref:DUF6594 domain-containing protein n=1 Tax=Phialocephala subalpina TaxID=576137 RepID=A0A1L7WQB5_9HELO|nr:uncharacterized protein PAC_04864 [Phialocephala subalpina]